MRTPAHTKLFGTDGIRGRAGEFPLDPKTVTAIGMAVGELLNGRIVVGRDPRESSPWILDRLQAGIERRGAAVHDAGVLPTPAVALLTHRTSAAGGAMISASHNAFEDNGIKIFGANGQKLDDASEARIEERVSELLSQNAITTAPDNGTTTRAAVSPDRDLYLAELAKRFPSGRWLEGLRIVCDCANGATSEVAPALFGSLGAAVETIHSTPDGRNINAGCGAVHPQSLVDWVRTHAVDLGVAYDGDGDRSLFVTGTGRLIDGDGVLLVMARHMLAQGRLSPPGVVGTSMTNVALEQKLESEGIGLARVDVGDRYVFRRMSDAGIRLGGEPSGHIIFEDFGLSGDGLLTTLKLCDAMRERSMSLDQLTSDWTPAPQLLRNVRVQRKTPIASLPELSAKIHETETVLAGRGRVVVRYSGTERLLRIMIESDSSETNERLADELEDVVTRALNRP